MKYKKSYGALVAPQRWKYSHSEVIDIDPAEAERQNKMSDMTGIRYDPVVENGRPLNDREHILTDLDMEDNPDLAERGLKVGDLVAFPVINRNTKPKEPIADEKPGTETTKAAEHTGPGPETLKNQAGEVTDGKTEVPGPAPKEEPRAQTGTAPETKSPEAKA